MKLRNKKTGEIWDICIIVNHKEYRSIEELYEDYEDYKPTEPLIKDPKTRKAVRAWAEANGTSGLTFDGCYILTDEQMNDIEFGTTKPFEELEKDICYTIEELCGSEE